MFGFRRLVFGSIVALIGFYAGIQQAAFWNTETAVNTTSVQAPQADYQLDENQPQAAARHSNMLKASGKTLLPQGVIGAVALLVAFAVWHLNGRKSNLAAQTASGWQTDTDAKRLSRKQELLTAVPALAAPRHLFQNPYGREASHFSFEDQVKFAIEASMRAGRVIGVIHFHLAPQIGAHPAAADGASQPPLEAVAQAFRACLRRSDHVRILNGREIAVFISLLAGQKDLQSIASRLHRAALPFGTFAAQTPGTAIYPLHGYDAGELIATARRQSIESC